MITNFIYLKHVSLKVIQIGEFPLQDRFQRPKIKQVTKFSNLKFLECV